MHAEDGGRTTRNGGRGMKEVLERLVALGEGGGEEADGKADGRGVLEDWRSMGVGGVASEPGAKAFANGWVLEGDEVVVKKTGEEGTVVSVSGPVNKGGAKKSADTLTPPGLGGRKDGKNGAMDVDEPEPGKKDSHPAARDAGPRVAVGVKLSFTSQVKLFPPSELQFSGPRVLATSASNASNRLVARRWEAMTRSALSNGVSHVYQTLYHRESYHRRYQ